jgi:ribosomal protein S18 acetylase RimI-like enzyme
MNELPEAAGLNRRAASAGVELRFGRREVLDDLEPLWLSMLDHHVEIGAAGLPVVSRDLSWSRRRSFYAGLLSEPEATIVTASRPAGLVGYCVAHVRHGADDTWPTGEVIGEIESLAVLASERGRGIGTLLLDAAEAHLAGHGAYDVMLEVVVGNASAIAFYERRGMAPITVSMLRLRSDRPGAP